MTNEEMKQLAEAHWVWLESLLHKVYVDAMVHGIKHGQEGEGSKENEKGEFEGKLGFTPLKAYSIINNKNGGK